MLRFLLLVLFPQPIVILMGFPAGSGVDVVARMLQEPMERALGAKIVTDYRTGAGGNLASEAVARAKPDGYTLLLAKWGQINISGRQESLSACPEMFI